jgi:prefoldin alpha subunit
MSSSNNNNTTALTASKELDAIAKELGVPGPESYEANLNNNAIIPTNIANSQSNQSKPQSQSLTATATTNNKPVPKPATNNSNNSANNSNNNNINNNTSNANRKPIKSAMRKAAPQQHPIYRTNPNDSTTDESETEQELRQEPLSQIQTDAKIEKYQKFIENKLKPDLKFALNKRDKIYDTISNYLQLAKNIQLIIDNQSGNNSIRTQIDLGCNFYAQAVIEDSNFICIDVGLGFFVEFTLNEALNFIKLKESQLNETTKKLTKQAANISSQIKMVYEGIASLMQLQQQITKQRRADMAY